jgi:hypothetical protein
LPELQLTRRAKRDIVELPGTVREAVLESVVLIELEPASATTECCTRSSRAESSSEQSGTEGWPVAVGGDSAREAEPTFLPDSRHGSGV